MNELKPCPFCGGEAELCYSEVDTFCRKCNVMQETELWNTRPIEDALNARIAELEAKNNRLVELAEGLADMVDWSGCDCDKPFILTEWEEFIAEVQE